MCNSAHRQLRKALSNPTLSIDCYSAHPHATPRFDPKWTPCFQCPPYESPQYHVTPQTNTPNIHPSSSPHSSPSTSPSLPSSHHSSPIPHPPVPSPPSSSPSPSPSPPHSSPPSPSASPNAYPQPTWDDSPPYTPSHRGRTPLSRTCTSGDGCGFWHSADRAGRSHGCSVGRTGGRRRDPGGGRGSRRHWGRRAYGCSACSRACDV